MIKPTQAIGGAIVIGALVFAWFMDDVAEVNQDHTLVAQFQRGTTPDINYLDVIGDVTSLLESNPNYTVTVVGHSGTRGPDDANMELSIQRAERGAQDLVRSGIDQDRIEVEGKGETDLLTQGKHETDTLWQNRLNRVEFFVEVN